MTEKITHSINAASDKLGSDISMAQSNPNILISPNLAMKISSGSVDQLPAAAGTTSNTLKTVKDQVRKLVEYQRLVEQDENLGMPEVQAALEIVNHFNEDMVQIQCNMNSLLQMMESMGSGLEAQ